MIQYNIILAEIYVCKYEKIKLLCATECPLLALSAEHSGSTAHKNHTEANMLNGHGLYANTFSLIDLVF